MLRGHNVLQTSLVTFTMFVIVFIHNVRTSVHTSDQ